jgi:hypothetical protein
MFLSGYLRHVTHGGQVPVSCLDFITQKRASPSPMWLGLNER